MNGSLEKPGYWWLAASWDNLLPSCIDCNRRRTHRFEGEEEALGKANLFPIEDEATRAKSVGEEANEVALLLHPCRDDPADFLIFPEEGVVAPLPGLGPLEQRIAEESIKVYGLGRPGLVGRRRDQRLKAESQFDAVNHRLRDFIADPDGASERRELATALRSLRSFREEKQEFALLGRHVLDPSLRKIEVFLEAKLGAELPAAPDQPESLLDRFIEAFAEAETRDPAEELDELLATG